MIHYIPLDTAYLCTDCDCISSNPQQCPACASKHLMGLSGILNRESNEKDRPRVPESKHP